jgi:lipid II:glycine glycyltransferase (peptidoglycan interpeptide bridge formation enzyme)
VRTGDGDALGARAWDELVLAQPDGNLLQSWSWGELQSRFGWQVSRLVFEDGAGLCSLQRTRTILPGGWIHYSPRGPLVAEPSRAEAVRALLQRAQSEQGVALRLEPEAPAGDAWEAVLAEDGFSKAEPVQPAATLILDLRPELEALRAAFKPKTRYNLALSERKGVTVEVSHDAATFARLSGETATRQGISLPGPAYYRALLDCFGDRGRLYLAQHQGKVLAGIIVVRFGTTATYLFGGSAEQGRELMPNYLLHWVAITQMREQGCTRYDWWGIPEQPSPDHPWFGLYRFKTGFGGERVRYAGLFQRVLRPARWRWEQGASRLKARLRRARVG